MKVLNKIKSIYLLAIVALLSFCMLLFPAMPKTASATGTMGTGEIEIATAKVVVQQYAQGVEKWAIMFKAEITQEQYNAITDNDTANVQFGMLIGPTEKLGEATDYAGLVENKFKAISYVGSVAGENVQKLEFVEGKAEYWGAIVYDDAQLNTQENGDKRVAAAEMDLTAVPFYTDGTTNVALLAQKKSATPRNILVESYLQQKDGEAVVDGVEINADTTVKNYAGEIGYMPEGYDTYICRSTNRLMVGAKQGTLEPASFNEPDVEFAIGGVARSATGEYEVYNAETEAEKLANLPKYGKVNVVAYSSEGVQVMKAQVAERVLMKFADAKVGTTGEIDPTEDYLAKLDSSSSKYISIFKNKNGSNKFLRFKDSDGTLMTQHTYVNLSIWYRSLEKGFDGLYVLGDNLTIPSSHAYVTDDGSQLYSSQNNNYTDASSDTQPSRAVAVLPTAYLGFNGTLDGRGFYIDVAKQGAVLPVMFGATIKNIGFLNLTQGSHQGGIASHAKSCAFENVYAQVTGGSNWNADLHKGLLMNVQNCTFKNFVADANAVAKSNMTGSLTYRTSVGAGSGVQCAGGGQGTVTAGVFAFQSYLDAYYSEEKGGILICLGDNQSKNTFINNLNEEDGKRLFPHLVHQQGTLQNGWIESSFSYNPITNKYVSYRKYTDKGTIFTGTSGENVYAVGTSPLYIGYQFSGVDATSGTTLKATTLATVFVNEAPKLKVEEGQEVQYADINYKVDFESGTGEYMAPTTYKMNQIDDKMFEFVDDDFYSLGEIIYRGKLTRHGEVRMANLLNGSAPQDVLEVQFINMEGWYDVANYEEMASYVLAQETPFDDAYWNVTEDGIVTWAKLLPQA